MSWFKEDFGDLPDPRVGNARRHDLLEVLTIALTATVCGAESCTDFADFAVDREDLFRSFLRLENGVPSHDTFSRIFRLLDPAAFSRCFERFVRNLGERGAGVIAIDGKALRRSFDRAAERSALAVVTAFSSATHLTIGQKSYRAGDGESEIVAARALLQCLDLKGALVTADALHCQVETAQIILKRGGDYLFALKANRPALHDMVRTFFDDPLCLEGLEQAETTDAEHGRLEVRHAWVCHDLSWMRGPKNACTEPVLLPNMKTLGMIESQVVREGKTTRARRYHISSKTLSANQYLHAARSHWAIENSLHWTLDVTFDEDGARNRLQNGPENLAILRRIALNMLKRAKPDISLRRKRKRAGWSNRFAQSILTQMR